MFAATLVYNKQRTGKFVLDGRQFVLRRVYFPDHPTPEWFVVDLLRHHEMAGLALSELLPNLVVALRERRWAADELHTMAETYGSKTTLALADKCITEALSA